MSEIKSRRDVEDAVVEKAARDSAFRQELLRDPKATIEREMSAVGGKVQLPAHVNIVVHEESADTFHLVLPAAPAQEAADVSDKELSEIAGGTATSGQACTAPGKQ